MRSSVHWKENRTLISNWPHSYISFLSKQWHHDALVLMMILQPVGLDLEMLAPYIPMDDDFQLRTPESLCSSPSSLGLELPFSSSTQTTPSVPAALAEPACSDTSQQNTGTTEQDNSRWGLTFRRTRSVLPINTYRKIIIFLHPRSLFLLIAFCISLESFFKTVIFLRNVKPVQSSRGILRP